MGKGRRGAKRKAGSWNDDASPDTELRAAKHAARFAAFYKRQLLGDTLADAGRHAEAGDAFAAAAAASQPGSPQQASATRRETPSKA